MSTEERRSVLFALNRDQIYKADIFLIVLDGRVPDEGACVELGLAYTQSQFVNKKKWIIGLRTDSRAAFIGAHLNPMLLIPLQFEFQDQDELFAFLKRKINGA